MPNPPLPLSSDLLGAARRIVVVRWGALALAGALVALAPPLVAVRLPWLPLVAVIGVAAAWNGITQYRLARQRGLGAGELVSQLCFDVVVWGVLLFFAGGAANPLVSLLLLPVVLAALTLTAMQAALVTLLAIGVHTVLMVAYVPLPIDDAGRAMQLHLTGMWLTFVVSASLLASIVWRMTQALAARDAQLAAAREAALRDERVLAMGTLAAGAAHELGTPLATLAVLAGEWRTDATLPAELRADLTTMATQISHCKAVIARLAERAGSARADDAPMVPARQWLAQVHAHWAALRGGVETRGPNYSDGDTAPNAATAGIAAGIAADIGATSHRMRAEPTLAQAVCNLLDNAARAGAPVTLRDLSTDGTFVVEVHDCGPGFADNVLANGGAMPLPAHAGGAGVGLMLTRAAVERLGGQLHLRNGDAGGTARIEIPWAGLTA